MNIYIRKMLRFCFDGIDVVDHDLKRGFDLDFYGTEASTATIIDRCGVRRD